MLTSGLQRNELMNCKNCNRILIVFTPRKTTGVSFPRLASVSAREEHAAYYMPQHATKQSHCLSIEWTVNVIRNRCRETLMISLNDPRRPDLTIKGLNWENSFWLWTDSRSMKGGATTVKDGLGTDAETRNNKNRDTKVSFKEPAKNHEG